MMSRVIIQAESHGKTSPHHSTKGSARSIRSLDTAVLMADVDWRPKSQTTWRSEATADTGLLLQNPTALISGGYSHTKPRTDRSDASELDTRVQRKLMCFDMDDFVNSSGDTTMRDLSPRTNASLDTKVLLRDPDENLDYGIQTGHYGLDSDRHCSDCSSNELDENESSVDSLDDLISARTVASLTTEVLLRPTEELVKVLGSRKAQKAGRHPKETHQVEAKRRETSDLAGSELSSTRATVLETKPVHSYQGMKSEISSTQSDRLSTSHHSKPKSPASGSFSKHYDSPSSQISSQRCLSDLGHADDDETRSETASTRVSNAEEISRRGARLNGENASMHHQRFSQHDYVSQPDSLRQGFKFNQVQRSKSTSRSRSRITSLSSVPDSPCSVETGISLGQRIMRKSQENESKMRKTRAAERNALLQSFMHDDESSCVSSQNSSLAFHDRSSKSSVKKKKRNHAVNRVQEDILDEALGLTVKGSPVQSRPMSSSSSLQEAAANEWTRRKQYNPRQSLKTEALCKKTGKPNGKPGTAVQRSGTVKESKPERQNGRIGAMSSTKNAPSTTSSDWTDDEQVTITVQ